MRKRKKNPKNRQRLINKILFAPCCIFLPTKPRHNSSLSEQKCTTLLQPAQERGLEIE